MGANTKKGREDRLANISNCTLIKIKKDRTQKINSIKGFKMYRNSRSIIDACEMQFESFKSNCSGFVKAVFQTLTGEILHGSADEILDQLENSYEWTALTRGDGITAKEKADEGYFVIGGLRSNELTPRRSHGHVVIIVRGALDSSHNKYPTGYWGMLGSIGEKNKTINWSFNRSDRYYVLYYVWQ